MVEVWGWGGGVGWDGMCGGVRGGGVGWGRVGWGGVRWGRVVGWGGVGLDSPTREIRNWNNTLGLTWELKRNRRNFPNFSSFSNFPNFPNVSTFSNFLF